MRSMKGADPSPSASIEGAEYNWLIVPRGEQRQASMAPKTKNRRASKFQKKANHAEVYDSLSVDCSFSTIYRKDSNVIGKSMREDRIIESGRRERHYWLALWRYRELFYVLAWRDLSVRYKQTIIVGINSTVAHHRGFYHNFRAHSQIALGRKSALCPDGFCGDAALDPLFDGFDRSIQ